MIVLETPNGRITVCEEQVVRFAEGLGGKRECVRWVVADAAELAPLRRLVSVDDPSQTLFVMDPGMVLHCAAGSLPATEGTTTYVVATPGEGSADWWIDLRHPVIIHDATRVGEQVTLDDAALPDRFRVELPAAGEEGKPCSS